MTYNITFLGLLLQILARNHQDKYIYIWRETNQCANLNEGHKNEQELLVWEDTLKAMEFLLLADLSNVPFE